MRDLDDSNEHGDLFLSCDALVDFVRPTISLSQWSIARLFGDVAAIR